MKFKIWPWTAIGELKRERDALREDLDFAKSAHGILVANIKELKAKHDLAETKSIAATEEAAQNKATALRMATIMHMRGLDKIPLLFLLFCLPCFGQPILRNNISTNLLGTAPADGWLLQSHTSIPQWTSTITAQVENWWDFCTNIDTNIWPIGVITWGIDGNRATIGDGASKGGIDFAIRYSPPFTNNPLLAGARRGELMVTTNGLAGATGTAIQNNAPTLYMNAGNGTNWIPIMQVYAPDVSSNDTSAAKVTGTFLVGIDTNGLSVSSGTGGSHGVLNGGIGIVAGAGGDASGTGSTAGAGGNVGTAGFVIQLFGGHGGASTNGGTGGNGGRSGAIIAIGGDGGISTNGAVAGQGGAGANLTMNGGKGASDGASGGGKNGGNAGGITTSGGDAFVDASGNKVAGGAGGLITTAASGTNAGGVLTMSSPGTSRRGGSTTTFGSSYAPMTIFTTSTTAGPNASSSQTSLLGTAQNLASTGQATGKVIASNIVDHVGRTLRWKLSGTITQPQITDTLDIVVNLGGSSFMDTGSQSFVNVTGTQTWTLTGEATCRTTGSASTWIGQMVFEYFSNATTINAFSTANTGTVNVDLTQDRAIDVLATFGKANTLQCTTAYFELIN